MDGGKEGDMHTDANESLRKLEGRVYVPLHRVSYEEETVVHGCGGTQGFKLPSRL